MGRRAALAAEPLKVEPQIDIPTHNSGLPLDAVQAVELEVQCRVVLTREGPYLVAMSDAEIERIKVRSIPQPGAAAGVHTIVRADRERFCEMLKGLSIDAWFEPAK